MAKPDPRGIDEIIGSQKNQSKMISEFIDGYKNYLSQIGPELLDRGQSLTGNHDSLIFRGNGLHLSGTFREEHVSNWLCWLLEMKILPDGLRNEVFNFLISKLIQTDSFLEFSKKDTYPHDFKVEKISTEEYLTYTDRVKKKTCSASWILLSTVVKKFWQ